MAKSNIALGAAKASKMDEFYTRLSDVEKELVHYRGHFRDKVVFCNCDDPYESNFFKYFALNFNALGLKKLIATCYDGSPIAQQELPLFPENETEPKRKAYKVEISEVPDLDGNGSTDLLDVQLLLKSSEYNVKAELKGNGDFRSQECVELLKQADIIVTNPPFSLFREYIAQLITYQKKFLILGNMNAVTYKEIFPLIRNNELWLGVTRHGTGSMWFRIPESFPEKSGQKVEDGVRYQTIGSTAWFTNLDHSLRHEEQILYKQYNPDEYPSYDNYEAINVDRVAEIPRDYKGIMGVPITFIGTYNPDQFEIIGTDSPYYIEELGIRPMGQKWIDEYRRHGGTGHLTANMHSLCLYDKDGVPQSVYKRVLIRNKKPQLS